MHGKYSDYYAIEWPCNITDLIGIILSTYLQYIQIEAIIEHITIIAILLSTYLVHTNCDGQRDSEI